MGVILWGLVLIIGIIMFCCCIVAGRADRRFDKIEEKNFLKNEH